MTARRWSKARCSAAIGAACLGGLLVAGCGFGTGAVVANSQGGGGQRVPTDLTLHTPFNGQAGRVTVEADLDLDRGESVEVLAVEYSLAGTDGPFVPATPAEAFPTDLRPGVIVPGAAHAARGDPSLLFVWNSHADLDAALRAAPSNWPTTARAMLRMTIRNLGTGEVLVRETGEFYLDEALLETVAGGGVGDGMQPAMASMLEPAGVAIDRGELFVTDTGNHRVRRIAMADGLAVSVTTTAGNGFEGIEDGVVPATLTSMRQPRALAVDPGRGMFIGERTPAGQGMLRYYDRQNGLLFRVIGGLQDVAALALSPARELFIAESGNGMVWRLDLGGVTPGLSPVPFSSLQPYVTSLVQPSALAVAQQDGATVLYVAERGRGRVLRRAGAMVTTFAGGGAGMPAIGLAADAVQLPAPVALCVGAQHVFVADVQLDVVLAIHAGSRTIDNVIAQVSAPGGVRPLQEPVAVGLDAQGRLCIVEGGAGGVPSDSGHRVIVALAAADPSAAAVQELAAGGVDRRLSQPIGGVNAGSTVLNYSNPG